MPYLKTRLLRGYTEVEELMDFIGDSAIVCGGWARYCASPAKNVFAAQDVDVYCKSEDAFHGLAATLASTGKMPIRAERPIAITYSVEQTLFPGCPTIQLIKPMVQGKVVTMGSSEEILDNFDFSVVRACVLNSKEVLVDEKFLDDETSKMLRIHNIHCPISTMYRVVKYIKKGYWIRPIEMMKLFVDWENRHPAYKARMAELFDISLNSQGNEEAGMSQEEIEELEALLHID